MACECPECRATRERKMKSYSDPEANKRAEGLLEEYLCQEQQEDWKKNGQVNVRGSDRRIFRLRPWDGPYDYGSILDQRGQITNVWPIGLMIPADWVIAMLLYLQWDARTVVSNGCHDYSYDAADVHDYSGMI